MNSHPVQMLDPVYRFLDGMIEEHGHLLYLGLVYVSIPLIVWILSGGLRRKNSRPEAHTSIIVIHTPTRPSPEPPPIIGSERDSFSDDDEDSFAA